jgi:hypothetical protein
MREKISIQPKKLKKEELKDAGIKPDSSTVYYEEDVRQSMREKGELKERALASIRTKKKNPESRINYADIKAFASINEIFEINMENTARDQDSRSGRRSILLMKA